MPTYDHSLAGCSTSAPSRTTPSVVSPSALKDACTPCRDGDSNRPVCLPTGCSVARQQSCTSLQQPMSSAHRMDESVQSERPLDAPTDARLTRRTQISRYRNRRTKARQFSARNPHVRSKIVRHTRRPNGAEQVVIEEMMAKKQRRNRMTENKPNEYRP
ncbi:pre-mRNA splicing factor prp17 [Culex quinquefasciatus]|uniref:Pre-mRNA splicing factor prp17 n=1 Tax=Culex quinquefasciatus TaxID=7176 RepID=B0XA02_CULQU|nr:pre-mRNA splicing factor prp17 [Culex quinquefasciatus]|eukprot:XP_001866474.1 pre-mRNA splicing factor prp17 [Culex quinquefasciatus]